MCIYTGVIEPIPLAKRIGGLIYAYFLGTTDDGGNTGPTPDIELGDLRTNSGGVFANVKSVTPPADLPPVPDSGG